MKVTVIAIVVGELTTFTKMIYIGSGELGNKRDE